MVGMASRRARKSASVLWRWLMRASESVVQLIVVAIVAEGRGALGEIPEIGLVLLVEERVLGGEAFGERFDVLR